MVFKLTDDELKERIKRASVVAADAHDALEAYADGVPLEPSYARELAERLAHADSDLQDTVHELAMRPLQR